MFTSVDAKIQEDLGLDRKTIDKIRIRQQKVREKKEREKAKRLEKAQENPLEPIMVPKIRTSV